MIKSQDGLAVEAALWKRWTIEQDKNARVELFLFYGEWAHMIANLVLARYPHPLAEWGDYVHFASIGLLQALDRFSAERENKFQTFAEPYIRGAILKGLSCYVRDKQGPVSERLGNIVDNYQSAEHSAFETIVETAIDLAFGYFLESGIIPDTQPDNDPLGVYSRGHQQYQLDDYVNRLPERERQVIVSHYYQYLSFVEISALLDVSKARVSQLHRQAIKRIRNFYEQAEDLDFNW